MVPDVASCESALLIEVLLTVPCAVLHLWHSETFTISESHVLHVSEFVVGESTSCKKCLAGESDLPLTSIIESYLIL